MQHFPGQPPARAATGPRRSVVPPHLHFGSALAFVERRSSGRRARPPRSPAQRWQLAGFIALAVVVALVAPYTYIARAPIRQHPSALTILRADRSLVPPLLPASRRTDHVIIISVDGLRPDAIARHAPQAIRRLAREGSVSLAAQTIVPSLTLPSHTSMLTGVPPSVHGITWNTDLTLVRGQHLPVPTVFHVAKQAGLRTAAFFSKSKFHHLEDLEVLDYSQSPDGGWGKILGYRTAEDVERYLRTGRPNLMFVHFGDPDYTGHFMGWDTRSYGAAVRAADEGVARVLAAADRAFGAGQYVVILTADHGGVGRSHAAPDRRNRTIPWIAWGEGVAGGTRLAPGIRTMDTAATSLWLLGLQVPAHFIGRPVTGAFTRR